MVAGWHRRVTICHGSIHMEIDLGERPFSAGRLSGRPHAEQHVHHRIVWIPVVHSGISRPKLLVFGGYDGIEVMGDLWELDLRGLAANYTKKEETAKYSGNCVWRMRAGSTEDNKWLHSCGSDGEGRGQAEQCAINDILLRAFLQARVPKFFELLKHRTLQHSIA